MFAWNKQLSHLVEGESGKNVYGELVFEISNCHFFGVSLFVARSSIDERGPKTNNDVKNKRKINQVVDKCEARVTKRWRVKRHIQRYGKAVERGQNHNE